MTALRQSRRSVSLSRAVHRAAQDVAAKRGVTLSHFVEIALRWAGVAVPEGQHQTIAHAEKAKRGRMRPMSGWVRR